MTSFKEIYHSVYNTSSYPKPESPKKMQSHSNSVYQRLIMKDSLRKKQIEAMRVQKKFDEQQLYKGIHFVYLILNYTDKPDISPTSVKIISRQRKQGDGQLTPKYSSNYFMKDALNYKQKQKQKQYKNELEIMKRESEYVRDSPKINATSQYINRSVHNLLQWK